MNGIGAGTLFALGVAVLAFGAFLIIWFKLTRHTTHPAMNDDKAASPVSWRQIAADLYEAIGVIDNDTPGGFEVHRRNMPIVRAAIDAYEYATDADECPT